MGSTAYSHHDLLELLFTCCGVSYVRIEIQKMELERKRSEIHLYLVLYSDATFLGIQRILGNHSLVRDIICHCHFG